MGITVGIVVLSLIVGTLLIYNRMVSLRNRVEEAWSAIDVMLKKRYDLIPRIVDIVKGYTQHEKEVLQQVTQDRAGAQSATSPGEKGIAEGKLNRSVRNLLVAVENYPDLKAGTNFLQLQEELSRVEEDLQRARRYYNGTVRVYNTYIESIPGVFLAHPFGFKKSAFFEIKEPAEREVSDIDFNKK